MNESALRFKELRLMSITKVEHFDLLGRGRTESLINCNAKKVDFVSVGRFNNFGLRNRVQLSSGARGPSKKHLESPKNPAEMLVLLKTLPLECDISVSDCFTI